MNCYSQDKLIDFWNKRCLYTTEDSGITKGINYSMKIPCDWKDFKPKKSNNVVKGFTYLFKDKSSILSEVLIKKLFKELNDEEISVLLSIENLRKILNNTGVFISGCYIVIGNLSCTELIYQQKTSDKILSYSIMNFLVIKDKLICGSFNSTPSSNFYSKSMFVKYKPLFRDIANSIEISIQ